MDDNGICLPQQLEYIATTYLLGSGSISHEFFFSTLKL
jgi:hypothetical protein